MTGARDFTELQFWQKARCWSKTIYELTRKSPFSSDRRLVVQINDSSESVMANIAEGFGRGTQNELVLFLGYAIGSLNETQSHLYAAYDRRYLVEDDLGTLLHQGHDIRRLIVGFMRSMVKPRSGVKHLGRRPSWTDQVKEIYERVIGQRDLPPDGGQSNDEP